MLYFAVASKNFDGGINVTASHNPKEYNGLKIIGKEAHSICGDEIQDIRKLIENKDFETGKGNIKTLDIFKEYAKNLASKIKPARKLKVVIDAGNGITGPFYTKIFEAVGAEIIPLFCEPNGNYPNHQPDPVVEKNLEDMQKKVRKENADLGIAFDGDGDRMGVVDENGKTHDANQLLILLARNILQKKKTSVIYTVSCSSTIADEVKKEGGEAIMVPVGHSFVEKAMRKHKAILGGEQSGHFFIADDYYSFDDACFTGLKILEIAASENKPFSKYFETMPKVTALPEVRPYCSDETKFQVIKNVSDELGKIYDINTMDGVRIDLENGAWASIRASNTSPVLSVVMEARSKKDLENLDNTIWKTLDKYGVTKNS